MEDLAIITPTSDRPMAFQLCERWMVRAMAHYGRPVHWYVVDDGVEPAQCTLEQTVIRRVPCASPTESFLRNLSAGLEAVRESRVVFIEDDDWYAADYLSMMAESLERADIVGEGCAKYYSVPSRKYHVFPNYDHASLCQTGIRRRLLDWFKNYVARSTAAYVDLPLWKEGAAKFTRQLAGESLRCVGIKGLPGKKGLSEGHDGAPNWEGDDSRGEVLRSWLGVEDAAIYLNLDHSH